MATTRFPADYFDGRSSVRHAVDVEIDGDTVRVRGVDVALDLARSQLHIQPRLGKLPVRIGLPEGGLLVAKAEDVSTTLTIPRATGLAHRLESHAGVVAASVVGVAIAIGIAVAWGIPWIARVVAYRIPPALERDIATEGLRQLDRLVFRKSELPPERKADISAVFAGLTAVASGAAHDARLEFRDGGAIGANAFALPGGVVVITDQLVVLLGDDDRIAAVLAHEAGHLENRHGTRQVLQGTLGGLLALTVMGDASAVTSIAVSLPTVVLHQSYSRDFERDADHYAYGLLRATGRSPRLLGDALALLQKSVEARSESCRTPADEKDETAETEEKGGPKAEKAPPKVEPERIEPKPPGTGKGESTPRSRLPSYLATHPATEERIRDAEEAAAR